MIFVADILLIIIEILVFPFRDPLIIYISIFNFWVGSRHVRKDLVENDPSSLQALDPAIFWSRSTLLVCANC